MRLRPEQLAQALSRSLAPLYLVSGDEPLLVGEAADAIRAAARAQGFSERQVFFVERGFSWDELLNSAQSLSLFSEKRLIELRMPSGKPDKGAQMIEDLAGRPQPDLLILIVTDRLDKKATETAWVRAIEKAGVFVPVWPVETAALPQWLKARAQGMKVELASDAAQIIVERVEGNLLAAKQELEKLALLAAGRRIDAKLVEGSVGDSARYDVFQLSQAAAQGEAQRALKILVGLRSEGVEPTLILWALLREIRGLWQARERERLASSARGSGWNLAATPTSQSLSRLRKLPLARLLVQASQVDRTLKGVAPGDAWSALTALTGALAGALQAGAESGRVAS
ncbi:MAG TPA: DNA polymerase III subunit delta [Steroidobacteraceae bacterium]|jgi:DNA polymerase-3 subunit delta